MTLDGLTTPQVSALLLQTLRSKLLDERGDYSGGVFLPEVTHIRTGRRADALFVGLSNAAGRRLDGYEIKATRSDWLREVRDTTKADTWADECHTWTIVAAPNVVKVEELPPGFGLLELRITPKTTRLRSLVASTEYTSRVPSWDALHAIIGRMESLRIKDVQATRTEERAAASQRQADLTRQHQEMQYDWHKYKTSHRILTSIQEAIGMEISAYSMRDSISVNDFTALVKTYLQAGKDVSVAAAKIHNRYGRDNIREIEESITLLKTGLRKLRNISLH